MSWDIVLSESASLTYVSDVEARKYISVEVEPTSSRWPSETELPKWLF